MCICSRHFLLTEKDFTAHGQLLTDKGSATDTRRTDRGSLGHATTLSYHYLWRKQTNWCKLVVTNLEQKLNHTKSQLVVLMVVESSAENTR